MSRATQTQKYMSARRILTTVRKLIERPEAKRSGRSKEIGTRNYQTQLMANVIHCIIFAIIRDHVTRHVTTHGQYTNNPSELSRLISVRLVALHIRELGRSRDTPYKVIMTREQKETSSY